MTLVETEEVKQNIRLNKDILALLQFDGPEKDGLIKQDLWGKNFCIWKDCLQNIFGKDQAEWDKERQNVCEEFGLGREPPRKNPMVVEATLGRFYKGKPIEKLEKLCLEISKVLEPIKAVD